LDVPLVDFEKSFETTRARELAELEARESLAIAPSAIFCGQQVTRGNRGVSQGGAVLLKRKASIATQQG
jgi:hypothetical protein